MSLSLGLAVYLVIWWLTLFMVLPWGITRPKPNQIRLGEDPGAPAKPELLKKFLATSLISLFLFAIFYLIYESGWVTFR